MNRKQDSHTLSDDYENKWEEKQMRKQQWNTHCCPRIHHDCIWGNGGVAPLSSQSQYKMGLSIQPHAPAALTPGEEAPVTTEQEAWWVLQLVWMLQTRKTVCSQQESKMTLPSFVQPKA